jgi:hypothetical protein
MLSHQVIDSPLKKISFVLAYSRFIEIVRWYTEELTKSAAMVYLEPILNTICIHNIIDTAPNEHKVIAREMLS